MIKSLQRGNIYPVEIERKGKGEVMFIETGPKFKSINVYDMCMILIRNTNLLTIVQKKGGGAQPRPEEPKNKDLKQGKKQAGVEDSASQADRKARSWPNLLTICIWKNLGLCWLGVLECVLMK